jgi:hypothetical protein
MKSVNLAEGLRARKGGLGVALPPRAARGRTVRLIKKYYPRVQTRRFHMQLFDFPADFFVTRN